MGFVFLFIFMHRGSGSFVCLCCKVYVCKIYIDSDCVFKLQSKALLPAATKAKLSSFKLTHLDYLAPKQNLHTKLSKSPEAIS